MREKRSRRRRRLQHLVSPQVTLLSYVQISLDKVRETFDEESAIMFQWFEDVGYEADIAALRQEYSDLMTFEQYLRQYGWALYGKA